MKITGFSVEQYVMRLDRRLGDANLPAGFDVMPASILFLETDANITGIAVGFSAAGVPALFPAIEGADPRETAGLWIRLNDRLHKAGNEGEANFALSAIDIALWDLKAKLADEPVWQTLGAREPRVKAYASGLDYPLSDDELFAFYRGFAERGVDGGKLKVGLDLRTDLRRLGVVREALSVASERPVLMVDANEYWSPKQAVRYIGRLEEHFELAVVEEPARRWDYAGLRTVSRQVAAAVATGENLNSVADFFPLITQQAVDLVDVSPLHSGVTGCRQVAHLAAAYHLPVSMTNCQANFMAHVAAALPNHTSMEVIGTNRDQGLSFDNQIEDGFIVLGQSKGFGVEIDREKLAALQASPPPGPIQFPFPRREGAGRYLVPPERGEE